MKSPRFCKDHLLEAAEMRKEYKLTIQAVGQNAKDAVERAVEMLNLGASFDEIIFLHEVPESIHNPTINGSSGWTR
jgi:hypothetical protein